MNQAVEKIRGGLVVSCQAREDNPLYGPVFMAAMAVAAERAGAVGIRANRPDDVAAIRARVNLPIIGIYKKKVDGVEIITPDFELAREIVAAGADIVAISCARYQRPLDEALGELILRIKRDLKTPVMADVGTVEEGITAARLGADLVASTLQGYTPDTVWTVGPDVELLSRLVASQPCPVVAEGRYSRPEHVREALDRGAYAVVVGTAITNPMAITAGFVAATRR
ncbi:MAG: N-acetylmannosamine-6-phosphate 2-epimerase [Bacillota bacterium]|nr:N-acetylmannosamine-6-phosphate 2-epimerase [Bacillota bacterium]